MSRCDIIGPLRPTKGTFMRALSFALVVVGCCFASLGSAEARSCTEQRNNCIKGVQSRGDAGGQWTAECRRAHAACMQSGVWQTYGYSGRTISDMVKK